TGTKVKAALVAATEAAAKLAKVEGEDLFQAAKKAAEQHIELAKSGALTAEGLKTARIQAEAVTLAYKNAALAGFDFSKLQEELVAHIKLIEGTAAKLDFHEFRLGIKEAVTAAQQFGVETGRTLDAIQAKIDATKGHAAAFASSLKEIGASSDLETRKQVEDVDKD